MRENARPTALRTVGSPPVSRSWAPAISAPLKNTEMMPRRSAPTKNTTIIAGFSSMVVSPWEDVVDSVRKVRTSTTTITAADARNDSTGIHSNSRSFFSTPQDVFANCHVLRMRPIASPPAR